MEPRIFKFGTPYVDMYNSMSATPEDTAFFDRNGVLQLCRRGKYVCFCLLYFLFPIFIRVLYTFLTAANHHTNYY